LHEWLEVQTPFHKWIQRRIDEWGFTQDVDFSVMDNFVQNPQGGRPSTDYLISLDMAKELSMVERTAKGKEARQYFIACEKALRNPGQSLTEGTKAFIYAAVKQVVVEALQTAQSLNSEEIDDTDDRDFENTWGFSWQHQWEQMIMAFLAGYENSTFTLKTIATDCLGIKNLDRATEMRIGTILKRLGYEKKQVRIPFTHAHQHIYRSRW